MLPVFLLTTFLSATLLFLVQPLFAKMVLPLLGGAPGVWNTAMLFFQACLLGGYAFAHFGPRLLGARRHAVLQVLIVALPVLLLPLSIPAGADPTTAAHPTLWLLGFMLVTIGAPFFALSTTSPTIQHWLGASGHARAGNPYFLYVASNVGSLLALLAYPVVVEPFLSLRLQQQLWGYGYALLALLTLAAARSAFQRAPRPTGPSAAHAASSASAATATPEPAPTLRRRALWVLGAFIPSSLLLGVTAFVTSEVAAVPLLWILPLALYLGTFILAFSSWQVPSDHVLRRTLAMLVVPLLLVVALHLRIQPIATLILLNLAVFFVAALLCHRRLSGTRPGPAHLTEFYLWLSVGGVLGGIFNALLAPVLFDTHFEYPLVLLLACLHALRPEAAAPADIRPARLAAAATVVGSGLALLLLRALPLSTLPAAPLLFMAAPALACFLASRRPVPFTVALAVLFFASQAATVTPGRQLHIERSFFGINRVTEDTALGVRHLYHGLTIHGIQSTEPRRRRTAFSYYHDRSPSGSVLAALARKPGARVGLVGLGAGSLAVYAAPGQAWTFFEIDPVVARIAADPRYFTFLHDAPTPPRLVLGDARLTLAREPDHQFDVLVIDAFSSDAIPVHLMTREAFALYQSKLKPGGAILCHISNNHLDLEPILGGIAADRGLTALTCIDGESDDLGRMASTWMLFYSGPRPPWLPPTANDWIPARTCPPSQVWRDDFSSVLSVMRWR
jgi:hypothetical protein